MSDCDTPMSSCFTHFQQPIDAIALPERFTFPFYYQPHPLCVLAAEQLQQHLAEQTAWQHNFGLEGESEGAIGKMFGVLVVENQVGEIGFLAGFSGKLAERNLLPGFVPPVFDMLTEGSFFLREQEQINAINHRITELEAIPELAQVRDTLISVKASAEQQLAAHREKMITGRQQRKVARQQAEQLLSEPELSERLAELSRQSVVEKLQLRDLKIACEAKVTEAEQRLDQLLAPIAALKQERRQRSNALQKQLFAQYQFLNISDEPRDLAAIFANTAARVPPAAAGECAAPKLLQYAFKHKLRPVAMAEFWWGCSPKSEIRRHGHYYPSCSGKCEPILGHMLDGIELDPNPLLANPAEGKELEIVYQDKDMVVVNKPAEFLSVPGRHIQDSVQTRIQQLFPAATGGVVVHRLDMSTSGLMVLALNARAHKQLQKQFIGRSAQKRYVALIDGVLAADQGEIGLPLRGDPDDRPRQLVCHQHGKPAHTRWQVCERREGATKVYLYPKTGRTHQLRVHCAHPEGLNMPIIGDDLYGSKASRLHLHAESLTITHPITREPMHFQVDAEF